LFYNGFDESNPYIYFSFLFKDDRRDACPTVWVEIASLLRCLAMTKMDSHSPIRSRTGFMGMTERIRRAFLFPYNFNYLVNNLVESVDCKIASFVENNMAVCCEYAVWSHIARLL